MLPLVSALWFLTTIILGGIHQPNYQHMSQYISELDAAEIHQKNGFCKTKNLG
jgi:hypothetical protein